MATAKPDTDDLMTCPICFEQFTDPKYLPCLHTFCRLCLKSYIVTQLGEGKKAETFTCPVCRRVVNIDQTVTSEKIVDTLPGNHLMVTLIDRSKVLKGEKCCDPCNAKNQKTAAILWCTSCQEAMCENCNAFHKQFKISRNHVTVPIGDVSNDLSKLSQLESEEPCLKHPGNILQVYCADHKEMCCVVCLATNHRKCEHVSTLEDVVTGVNGDQVMKDFTELLNKIDDVTGKLRMKTEENINRLDVQRDEITEKVAFTVKKAKDNLDHLQMDFETKFQTKHKEQHLKLTEGRDRFGILQENVKKGKKLIETVREVGSPKQLFIAQEKLKLQLLDQMKSVKIDVKELACVEYILKIADIVPSVADSLTSVAEVEIKQSLDLSTNVSRVENMVKALCNNEEFESLPKEISESVNVTTLQVTKICSIKGNFKGGTYLPDGRLILCGWLDRKLQVYDKDGSYLFENVLPIDVQIKMALLFRLNTLETVCYVSQNEILVSFPNSQCITRYKVTKDQFQEKSSISCNDRPLGLAVTKNNLIVGYRDKVDILSMDGQFRDTLSHRQSDFTSNVATSSTGKVFYGDEDVVICKTLDGAEETRYTSPAIRSVTGIAVDKYENVYISGYGSNSLFVFSPDGKQSKELIQNVQGPTFIGFDSDGTKFFLTHSSGADIYICQFN